MQMNDSVENNLDMIFKSWNHFFKNSRPGLFSQFTIKYPYCTRKCKFCRYPTVTGNDFNDFATHLDVHIKTYKNIFDKSFKFGTFKLVGGTPSLMSNKELTHVVKSAEDAFSFHSNIVRSIEIDPNYFTMKNVDDYYNLGFNKFLIGLQSQDPTVMRSMNREIAFDINEFMKIIQYARSKGIIVCVDLLYGLYDTAEENDAKLQEEINKVINHVDVVYIYQWSGLPEIKFSKNHITRNYFYKQPVGRDGLNKRRWVDDI